METNIKAQFTGSEEDKKILTPKEWIVFKKHCEGWTKKMIVDYVCRSEDTVKSQESSIRRKFKTHSMAHAMVKAIAKGIITLTALCLAIISIAITFIDNDDFNDIRRSPRTVRTQRLNRSFRDHVV